MIIYTPVSEYIKFMSDYFKNECFLKENKYVLYILLRNDVRRYTLVCLDNGFHEVG